MTEAKLEASGAAEIIDGKDAARRLRDAIKVAVEDLKSQHPITPGLATVLVGDDPASTVYVRNKAKVAVKMGMESFQHALPHDINQRELITLLQGLNDDPSVHGILVQLPLPQHIDEAAIIATLDPIKDVDGLHPTNIGQLVSMGRGPVPCTPQGCILLLKETVDDLTGCDAVVVGRSELFGKPMAQLLLKENCTVTMAHSRTIGLADHCRRADILVVAVGQKEMVRGDWIKPGATVIDVGINRIERGGESLIVGDVRFEEAVSVAGAITPVPGGVGPMTIACLMNNTLIACCAQHGITGVNIPEKLEPDGGPIN